MGTNWTKDQQKVIDGRDRNILVSAAAGSGKTAVLVQRIIEMITDKNHPIDIDRLLVVTFTKAAAAQMKNRVGEAIEKQLADFPEDEHLQRQAALLHNAQITTIDSFCKNIVRNYFHVIDLEPFLRVADETELALIKTEILKGLIEECYAEGNKSFLEFTEIFAPGRTDGNIEELVLRLYEISCSYPWPEEWLKECNSIYQITSLADLEKAGWLNELVSYLSEILGEYKRLAQKALEICHEADGPSQYEEAIFSDISQIEFCMDSVNYQEYFEAFNKVNSARLSSKRNKDASEEKKEFVKSLRESYMKSGLLSLKSQFFYQQPEEMLEDIKKMSPYIGELINLTLMFLERYRNEKLEQGIMDFSDLEHFALEILVEHGEDGTGPSPVAIELQGYYEEIMIDEYQDSNFVQELLLGSLCRSPENKPYMFMVGDVKQSIYQFRLARPEIFMEKYNSYSLDEGKLQRIDLHQNFRSRETVIQSVNYLFERIMKKGLGGICYDEAASLIPGRDFGDNQRGASDAAPDDDKKDNICKKRISGKTNVILLEQKNDGDGELIEKRALEAAAIAHKICDMVQGDNPLYVFGEDGYRPVMYRDIVILLRSMSGWSEEFVETLTDLKVPAYAETKTGYFSTIEVETVLNFLKVIDNPRQDIPLAAVLRSQIAGLSDEELARLGVLSERIDFWDVVRILVGIKNEDGGLSDEEEKTESQNIYNYGGISQLSSEMAWEELQISGREKADLENKLYYFVKLLDDYRKMAMDCSVYELLVDIYKRTGFYDIMSAMPAGERRAANLNILLQKALDFANQGHSGIFGFTHYIESLKKSQIDFGEAADAGEQANAVRIMSIHKSKGLQFPVVFLAGMGKQFNLQDARRAAIIDADYGVGADFVDLELRYKQPTLIKKFMSTQIKRNTLAEEIRILYVALTRAEELLVITGSASDLPKKWDKWRQKSTLIDSAMLLGSQTYLDWIMPALFDGMYAEALDVYENEAVTSCGGGLFEVEVLGQQDIILQEKEGMVNSLDNYVKLKQWDLETVYDEEMAQALSVIDKEHYFFMQDLELPVKVSVSELKRGAMSEKADELSEDSESYTLFLKEYNKGEKSENKNKGVSAAALGTLYHMVMEKFPYKEMSENIHFDFGSYLDILVKKGYLTKEESNCLNIQKFYDFFGSNIGKRMALAAASGRLKREQQFMIGISAKEIYKDIDSDELILVQGIIDAYFEEDGKIILVDYKTDFVSDDGEGLVKKYSAQLDYYAKALMRLTGKEVSEKIIYSFSIGKEIKV